MTKTGADRQRVGNVAIIPPVGTRVTILSLDAARRLSQRHRASGVILLALAVTMTACGSGGDTAVDLADPTVATSSDPDSTTTTGPAAETTSTPPDRTTESTPVPPENVFADIDVIDVYTGEWVNLEAELAGGDTPVLLWFWAPH